MADGIKRVLCNDPGCQKHNDAPDTKEHPNPVIERVGNIIAQNRYANGMIVSAWANDGELHETARAVAAALARSGASLGDEVDLEKLAADATEQRFALRLASADQRNGYEVGYFDALKAIGGGSGYEK